MCGDDALLRFRTRPSYTIYHINCLRNPFGFLDITLPDQTIENTCLIFFVKVGFIKKNILSFPLNSASDRFFCCLLCSFISIYISLCFSCHLIMNSKMLKKKRNKIKSHYYVDIITSNALYIVCAICLLLNKLKLLFCAIV